MKIYIAAKYNRRFDLVSLADGLQALGHEVTSQWLWGGEEHKPIQEAAIMDVDDVVRADCIVFMGQPQASENRGGGRWFEFGLAYGLKKRCIAVLDMDPTVGGHTHLPLGHESVFTALPEVEIVKSPEELKELLSRGIMNSDNLNHHIVCPSCGLNSWDENGQCKTGCEAVKMGHGNCDM